MMPKRPRRSSGKQTVLRDRCLSTSGWMKCEISSERRMSSCDQRWSRLKSIAFIEMSRWQSKIRRGVLMVDQGSDRTFHGDDFDLVSERGRQAIGDGRPGGIG